MSQDTITAPIAGIETQKFARSRVDAATVGDARIKRVILPVGGRWSVDVKPLVGTELCEHAHVGFLAQGHFVGEYRDGTTFDHKAPAILAVEPGHDSWVEGEEEVVIIQFDFEHDTVQRLGLELEHG